jgi:hypothetical protein
MFGHLSPRNLNRQLGTVPGKILAFFTELPGSAITVTCKATWFHAAVADLEKHHQRLLS